MRPLGWALIQCDQCPWRKRKFGYVKRQEGPHARVTTVCGRRKRQVSARQGERPHKKGNLLTSCLQNCDKLNLRCLSHARRSNQSILQEISPGCSLEGLMLKLKLRYFGHLMRRVDSVEKTLMLGGIGVRRRRGRQRLRWLDGIID